MEVAEYQDRSTATASERYLSWILKVCAERFDRDFSLRGGFTKLSEEGSIAVDSNHRNAGCSRSEGVASATAREVGNHTQPRRGADSRELVTEEFRRWRSLRHELNDYRANRRSLLRVARGSR